MRKTKIIAIIVLILAFLATAIFYFYRHPITILDPKGQIALEERHLIIVAGLLALIVVVPVFVLAIMIAWKYRESNKKAKYRPEWDHNQAMEFTWWAIPIVIIAVLVVIIWQSSYQLNPFKPIASSNRAIPIQVVALDWKWLFIYPEQNIASVNLVQFPVNTPVSFELTSDTVMNSFWVPALGSQIYAMPGMSTQLNLIADQSGSFAGSSANISGTGFASMTFMAKASSVSAFNQWVKSARSSSNSLNQAAYNKLARPSQNNPASYYSSSVQNLYNSILAKYMVPAGTSSQSMQQMLGMPGMGM